MKSFIAHYAFDECDRFAIGRPTRKSDLQSRLVDGCDIPLPDIDGVNLCDPPIIVTGAWRGRCEKRLVVRRPIVIVNVKIRRRHLAHLINRDVQNSNALIVNGSVEHAGRHRRGHQWTAAACAFDVQEGNLFAVMRPMRPRCISSQVRNFLRIGGITFWSRVAAGLSPALEKNATVFESGDHARSKSFLSPVIGSLISLACALPEVLQIYVCFDVVAAVDCTHAKCVPSGERATSP